MNPQLIDVARGIAERAHTGQVDKIGAPYIEHPAMVVDLVQRLPGYLAADPDTREDAVVAAWLHDVIEDSPTTADDLRHAGLTHRAVNAVVALTRTEDVAPDDHYATITTKPVALLVKTADLASNLAPHRVAQLTRPPAPASTPGTPTPSPSSASLATPSPPSTADRSRTRHPFASC